MAHRPTKEYLVNKIIRLGAFALALVLTVGMAATRAQEATTAQDKPAPSVNAPPAKPAQIPLKVQLVLSRYQGDKKVGSIPYSLWVTTNERQTNLRMGLRVYPPQGSNNIGTDIDCSATTGVDNGVYKLSLTVTDTSLYPNDSQREDSGKAPPTLRTFLSNFVILLRDGQTAQYTTATDPVSGEVLKIDATLAVLK
jgi:hypothetical protein